MENYLIFQRPKLGLSMTFPVSLGTVLCLCYWLRVSVKKIMGGMGIKTGRELRNTQTIRKGILMIHNTCLQCIFHCTK